MFARKRSIRLSALGRSERTMIPAVLLTARLAFPFSVTSFPSSSSSSFQKSTGLSCFKLTADPLIDPPPAPPPPPCPWPPPPAPPPPPPPCPPPAPPPPCPPPPPVELLDKVAELLPIPVRTIRR